SVQLAEQREIQRLGLERGHLAGGVVEVTEDDRVGWTGRLAGGYDLAVANGAALLLGLDAGPVDALDAVGALLHDAAGADRDVRVAQQAEAVGGVVGVLEEVEAAHLVGTVV